MSKKSERLFETLNDIGGKHIDEAAEEMERKTFRWKSWAALAAVTALAVGIVGFAANIGGGSGGAGIRDMSSFMSYAGPILPMTLREENVNITAARDVTLDFEPWAPVWRSKINGKDQYDYSEDIRVTDEYTLTNASGQEQTISILYPFAGNLYELDELLPSLTLDGQKLDAALCPGGYSGGFYGAWGSHRENLPELSLAYAESWEAYREVLADGSYAANASADFPDLSGISVAVYEFTDPWGPQPDRESDFHPTVRASFAMDFGKTGLLTTGFHGGSWDPEAGTVTQSYTIPLKNERGEQDAYWIAVIGEDIRDLEVQVYDTGGPTGGSVIENAGVTVRRVDSDLETVLREVARIRYNWSDWPEAVGFELYFGLLKEEMADYYGILDNDSAVRYAGGIISDSDLDFANANRVFYLEAEVTIPAGQSVVLTADLVKNASFDFACANT